MPAWMWVAAVALGLLAAVVVLLVALRPRGARPEVARALFVEQRPRLEAEFFRAAAASGKPRGLRWTKCEWSPALELARDRQSGVLVALAGVTIAFEAIEGGDMEGVAAVGNLRNASAVFVFDGMRWATNGRAVFNLNPDEAIRHFGNQYEPIRS